MARKTRPESIGDAHLLRWRKYQRRTRTQFNRTLGCGGFSGFVEKKTSSQELGRIGPFEFRATKTPGWHADRNLDPLRKPYRLRKPIDKVVCVFIRT